MSICMEIEWNIHSHWAPLLMRATGYRFRWSPGFRRIRRRSRYLENRCDNPPPSPPPAVPRLLFCWPFLVSLSVRISPVKPHPRHSSKWDRSRIMGNRDITDPIGEYNIRLHPSIPPPPPRILNISPSRYTVRVRNHSDSSFLFSFFLESMENCRRRRSDVVR